MYGIRVMKWDIHEAAPNGLITDEPWPKCHQVAACRVPSQIRPHKPDEIPAENCTCGIYALRAFWMADIYAYHTLDHARYFELREIMFAVLVKGYGKLVIHETGWRAASAEILGVCTFWREPPPDEALYRTISAASFYQVPVLNSWEVVQVLKGSYETFQFSDTAGGDADAETAR